MNDPKQHQQVIRLVVSNNPEGMVARSITLTRTKLELDPERAELVFIHEVPNATAHFDHSGRL